MQLKIYNTLTKAKDDFVPVDSNNVRMYTCGPTVYNYAHIGNARPAVVSDLLVRILRFLYPKVTYVSNITDIDDKIIKASDETGVEIGVITAKYEKIYNEDMRALNVLKPDKQPHATEHIDDMIALIKKNINNNKAYESEGHVLFDVSSYPSYGKLSKRDADDQIAGSRVEVASYKKNPGDFILWKPSTENQPGWDSPWGFGRPGWHLECSAMSENCLGIPFDIHGGGMDLVFPHHENEIAQSCGSCNEDHNPQAYVKYWIHNALLNMDGEKMSKSLGNILYIRDLLKEYPGEVLRLALLSAHYRQPLNLTEDVLAQSQATLNRFYRNLNKNESIESYPDFLEFLPNSFLDSVCDDLNTSKAIASLNEISKKLSSSSNSENKKKFKTQLLACGYILGILQEKPKQWLGINEGSNSADSQAIEQLVLNRDAARKNKNFEEADQIRNTLLDMGIEIEDAPSGTTWRKVKK